jgi:hypothetical protein
MHEGDFFREATLRICGSLEIEKALWDCFMYLRGYIPADRIYFNVYDPGPHLPYLFSNLIARRQVLLNILGGTTHTGN